MGVLHPRLQTLLEAAQSEAKRFGHDAATKVHLAIALLKRHPDRVREYWGDVSEKGILAHASGPAGVGTAGELPEFLRKFSGSGDFLGAMCGVLGRDLGLSVGEDPPTCSSQPNALEVGPGESDGIAHRPSKKRLDHEAARRALLDAIVGQDEAVERVLSRLALTRADLDLNPHRPDGVFLFAGPTGVGKTAFAKALATAVLSDASALIRLDMSEYQNDQIAVAKLIGSGPGYVGYDSPTSWLTTRIHEKQNAVLLLDEIEKASPAVWTLFLQVFDDGRLTDGRGRTATFADIIIVMTSNIGAREFFDRPVGFVKAAAEQRQVASSVLNHIRRAIPPELFSRIDEIIIFNRLTFENIREIARREIARANANLARHGYALEVGDEVVDLVAENGYDPNVGSRHLLRNIERMLLLPLAKKGPGKYTVEVREDTLSWSAAD